MASAIGSGSLPFLYTDFHGGLNTKDAPYLLTDNQARDLSNVQGTTTGAIVKRTGLTTFASLAATPTSVHQVESVGPFLVVADGTTLQSINASGTVTTITTALTAGKRWEFLEGPVVSGQGPLYGMNGVDTPQQWTGSGSTVAWTATDVGGTVPNGTMCTYFKNQVFVSGVATTPSRVYWSAIADPTGWNPANLKGAGFVDFDPNDGEKITGLGVVGQYVLVAKPRKLWILIDPASASNRPLSTSVGCIAPRSLVSAPEGAYFLSEDRGVYLTNGSKLTPISDNILPTIYTNPGSLTNAAGSYYNAHYYLSLPIQQGSSTNDTTLDFDSILSSWWKHSFGSNQFAIWHPTGTANLMSAKATGIIVDQAFTPNVYTDNGSPFQWVWRGPWQSPTFYRRRRYPTPYFRKRLRQIRIDGSGTVDFSLAKDFAGGETLVRANVFSGPGSGASIFGAADGTISGASDSTIFGAPSTSRARIFGQGVANAFSFVFSSTSTTADEVFSYTMMITDRRDLVVS